MDHLQRGWAIVAGCVLVGGGLAYVASSQTHPDQTRNSTQAQPIDTMAPEDTGNSDAGVDPPMAAATPTEGSGDREYFEAYRRIPVTKDWLVGKWGSPECETDSVIVFARDGTYFDGGARGRFQVENGRITYFERVLVDLAQETEDRSQIDKPITSRIERAGPDSFLEDGTDVWDRCPVNQ